jgi:hypothetical protein
MKLALLLCAKEFSVDRGTNALNIWFLAEDFTISAFPFLLMPFSVMAVFERDEDEPEIQHPELKMALGREVMSQGLSVDFQGKLRSRYIMQIGGIPILAPGTLEITITDKKRRLGIYRIPVRASEPVETAAQSQPSQPSPVTVAPPQGQKPKRRPRKERR